MKAPLGYALVAAATACGTVAGTILGVRWAKILDEERQQGVPAPEDLPCCCGLEPATGPGVDVLGVFQNLAGPAFQTLTPPTSEEVLFEDIRAEYERRKFYRVGFPDTEFIRTEFGVTANHAAELKARFDREFGKD